MLRLRHSRWEEYAIVHHIASWTPNAGMSSMGSRNHPRRPVFGCSRYASRSMLQTTPSKGQPDESYQFSPPLNVLLF